MEFEAINFDSERMSVLSVLEEEDGGAAELMRCKLDYLQAQNGWMRQEYSALCGLVELQKQLIHSTAEQWPTVTTAIQQALQQRQQGLMKAKQQDEQADGELAIDEFIPFIYSFEEKIERLQREIKHREAALQQIQQAKLTDAGHRQTQFKSITAYDSQARLLDRVKKEIAVQQARKQRLEDELISCEKGEEESTVASQAQSRSKVSAPQEQSSAFERVIVLLKKKRFQNACLEQKLGRLRRAVDHKKMASSRLRAEIEGLEWNCLDGFVGAGGFVQAEKGDLSLAGRSFSANNASFSFDVSRFIRPKVHLRFQNL